MAEKLESYHFRRGVTYPEEWFDGGVWKLTEGEDFTHNAESVRSALQKIARDKGLTMRTSVSDGALIVQATKKTEVV